MTNYKKRHVGDEGNTLRVPVPENPASSVAVCLAKFSPLPSKNASLDDVLHLNSANLGLLSLLEGHELVYADGSLAPGLHAPELSPAPS